ncbi:hypothetical protein [Myceligenerans salitolerans]|uniref:Uncharacterized protein n=1 Tax=Myceligenerans salitolerans TaxID=1230528 RepID=A0ABS3I9N2_9MICO|nr:hypothetical protein [Myceligenerans salitolerans]MBO0609668.1 hypothetical protein [Myceligenerans salitolerans]
MSEKPPTAPPTGPESDDQAGESSHADVPLHDVVHPSEVRRAPRYGRFLLAGAVLGTVIGLGLGYYVVGTPEAQGMLKPGVYIGVTIAFTATLTTLAAGLIAVLADRRSLRKYERARTRR